LALILVLAVLTWIASLIRSDASLVDRAWGVLIAGAAVTYGLSWGVHSGRAAWMLALVVAWGVRLSTFITWRNWGHGEDRRYQEIRARNQPHFGWKSLYLVFGLQSLLAWLVSSPFIVGVSSTAPFGWLDGIGIVIAVSGIGFEAIGDWQMARFRADPKNSGRVMDSGLWRYSRHPNYFGETCMWWGVWLLALAGGGWSGAWTVASPLVMTFLLLKVSGVSLLEKDITERRPGYREYIANTSAFIPGRPRRTGAR
jgi:steroid 5-alpha reductase family enzyme